jgi:hypothetical protein
MPDSGDGSRLGLVNSYVALDKEHAPVLQVSGD